MNARRTYGLQAIVFGVTALTLAPSWPLRAQETPSAGEAPARVELRSTLAPTPGGLTADGAAQRAIALSPSVRRANANREKTREASERVRDSAIPNLELSATYTRLSEIEQPTFNFGGMEVTLFQQILSSKALSATLTIPVSDYFLTIWPGYQGAKGFTESASYRVEAERRTAWRDARELYYSYVRALGGAAIAGEAVRLLESHLSDVEAMFKAGRVTAADVELVKSQLETARAGHVRAQGGVSVLARTLMTRLDLPGTPGLGEDIFAPLQLPDTSGQDLEALTTRAMEARPEMRAMTSLLEANGHLLDAQRAGQLPRVFIQAGADYANPNPRFTPPMEEFHLTWDVTVGVAWSLSNILTADHQSEEARWELNALESDAEALRQGITLEIASSLNDLSTARTNLSAAEQGYSSAQQSYERRLLLYRADRATTTEVLNAQGEVQQASLALLGAHIDLRTALGRYSYATGELRLP